MPHLIIFTIGPVQSFIAQARKTQDLFAGSRILSELARQAYELIEEKSGEENIELIFPAFYDIDDNPITSNPNRFAVQLKGFAADKIQKLCEEVRKELQSYFVEIAEEYLKGLNGYNSIRSQVKVQLNNLLEIYWAAIDFNDSNYHERYLELESYLGGIKNMRLFAQTEEEGRKCNVDGVRNALFYKHTLNSNGQENAKPYAVQSPYCKIPFEDKRLTPGEGLSAVSLFKRLYNKVNTFPSTAEISLMDVISAINNNQEQARLLAEYKNLFGGSWDAQLLFEENLTTEYFKRQGLSDTVSKNGGIEKILNDYYYPLRQAIGNFKPSYYALIVFDGDGMGEWMSGSKLVDPSTLKRFQETTKDLLRDFGVWAMGYLNTPWGKAVYAGGDDFLGFVNLEHLHEVLSAMRLKFNEMVNEPLQVEKALFQLKPGNIFSFSAGVTIAHYKQPLGLVLDEARKAEHIAKENPGKNSFAISVIRHSGNTTTCVQSFGENQKAIEFITNELIDGNFSNKFIHNLIKEMRCWNGEISSELLKTEAFRLVKRAKSNLLEVDRTENMNRALGAVVGNEEKMFEENLENIIATLRVCDFISRCTKKEEENEIA